jgi:hypothetical protein
MTVKHINCLPLNCGTFVGSKQEICTRNHHLTPAAAGKTSVLREKKTAVVAILAKSHSTNPHGTITKAARTVAAANHSGQLTTMVKKGHAGTKDVMPVLKKDLTIKIAETADQVQGTATTAHANHLAKEKKVKAALVRTRKGMDRIKEPVDSEIITTARAGSLAKTAEKKGNHVHTLKGMTRTAATALQADPLSKEGTKVQKAGLKEAAVDFSRAISLLSANALTTTGKTAHAGNTKRISDRTTEAKEAETANHQAVARKKHSRACLSAGKQGNLSKEIPMPMSHAKNL